MIAEQMEAIERPLNEVDEIATRIQESAREEAGGIVEEVVATGRRIVTRILEDPAWRFGVLATLGVVVVTVVLLTRSRPRSREELMLDRSREALDRSREALDHILESMASRFER